MRTLFAVTLLSLATLLGTCTLLGEDAAERVDLEPPDIDLAELETCDDIEGALMAELQFVQYCTTDAQCGQVLPNTSCGCTRNLVARQEADTTRFYALVDLSVENQCDLGLFTSTCDCPRADGFVCVSNRCAWNYDQP